VVCQEFINSILKLTPIFIYFPQIIIKEGGFYEKTKNLFENSLKSDNILHIVI